MGHWYREVLVSAASRGICCFVSQAGLSMSEQIQFIRQAEPKLNITPSGISDFEEQRWGDRRGKVQ